MPCKENITCRLDKDLPVGAVARLYRIAGWIAEEGDTGFLPVMLKNSFAVAAAFDGGKLVGMMRALSDGVSDAYMLDLVVDPEYRKTGIGREIMNVLSEYLKSCGIDWIVLVGAPDTENFYGRTNARRMDGYVPYRMP